MGLRCCVVDQPTVDLGIDDEDVGKFELMFVRR